MAYEKVRDRVKDAALTQMFQELEVSDIEKQNIEMEAKIMAEFGDDPDNVEWELQVHRAGYGKNSNLAYLFSVDQNGFRGLKERIRDDYGTGNYRIYVLKNSKLVRNFGLSIETQPREIVEERKNNDVQALSHMFSQQMQQQTHMIERLIEKNERAVVPAQSDPLAMMEKAVSLVAGLQRPQDNTFAVFKMAFDMAKELGGTKEVGKTGMDLLSDFLQSPMAEKIAEGMTFTARNGSPVPQPQSIPSKPVNGKPIVRPPRQEPNAAAPNPQEQMAMQIAGQVNYLVSRAAAGSDPELYADWVYDNVPGEVLGPMLAHPDLIGEFTKMVPAVATHRPWFEALLAGVNAIMLEETQVEETDENLSHVPGTSHSAPIIPDENPFGEGGHTGNLETDAGSGQEI